jgi:hypothetical protein
MDYTVTEQFNLAILKEYMRASEKFPPFHSSHEGYAVIKEELDELWGEIKKKPTDRSLRLMREECVQVGAMALRFLVDLCPVEE